MADSRWETILVLPKRGGGSLKSLDDVPVEDQELAVGRAIMYAERVGDAREATWARMRLAMALYYGPTPVPEAIRRCHQSWRRRRRTRW